MKAFEKAKSETIESFNKSENKTRTSFNGVVSSICEKYSIEPFSILYSLGLA